MLKEIIEHGTANLNLRNKQNLSSLSLSAQLGHEEVITCRLLYF